MAEPRILPLTAAQAGLLAETPLDGDDPYIAQVHVDVAGPVAPDALSAACRTALDKVPNLRAALDATSARTPVLVLGAAGPGEWAVADLRDGADPDEEMRRLRAARFDVAEGDLVRFALLRLPGDVSRLVLTFHHLLLDGWSAGLLLRLVLRCLVAGPATPAPPPVTRLLRWQATHRPDEEAWSAVLDGARPTAVATALVPPPVALPGRSAQLVDVPDHVARAVTTVARGAGTTAATVLHAAWGVTLARTFGRSDVLFAVVDSGRSAPVEGVDEIVGMLVVTTVRRIRAVSSVDDALAELGREVASTAGAAPLPLAAVGARLGADVAADTLVVVDNQAGLFEDVRLPGGLRVVGGGGTQQSAFPVVLHVTTTPDLRLEIQYDRATVGTEAAGTLARVMADALADVVRGGAPCRAAQLTHRATAPAAAVPDSAPSPLGRVLEVARRDPSRPAVVDAYGPTTYGELVRRASRIAGALVDDGIRTGDVVALCMDRSAELAAAVLAVRWAGAAYLALDPQQPDERREDLVRRTGCRVVLRTGEVSATGPTLPEPSAGGGDLAYVVHTSGSSGATKGVAVPDDALAAQLAWLGDHVAVTPEDRVLWRTSVAFDASVWELWLPLVTGATVVAAGPGEGADPLALRRLLGEVTVAQVVPTLLGPVVDGGSWRPPPGLRLLAVGGEPFPGSLARHVLRPGGPRVLNLYGPAETTVQVAAHDVGPEDLLGTTVPVGVPVAGTGLRVLSDELAELPEHVLGELWVTGAQLAVGYLGEPGRTAASFVAAPGGAPGERAYRTGDLAWRGPRGLVVVGRRDRQVKIRGYRVDLAEVEAATEALPGVRRCHALVRTTPAGTRQLVAALATGPVPGAEPDEAGVRAALARTLPGPLVPDLVVVTDGLPTLPSGKPDGVAVARLVEGAAAARRAGPGASGASGEFGTAAGDAADQDTVAAVRRAVAHVLGVPEVGPDDDVLALGVDSVSSLGVVARLRHDGLLLAPRDVHGARTPRAIAAVARAVGAGGDDDGTGKVPLTPFVAEQLGRGADRSFQVAVVRVPDGDGATLRRVGGALTATHAMLRARLVRQVGAPYLLVEPGPGPEVPVTVHDAEPAAVGAAVAAQVARAAGELDPDSGRMLALCAVRAGADTLLAVVVHHLAVDAVSMRVLLDDLREAWHETGSTGLPHAVTSYRTWALAVTEATAGPATGAPADATALPDPLPHQDGPAGRRTEHVPDDLAARMLAKDVPPERLVLAATALALHRVALADGRGTLRTVVLEVEGHGRDLLADALDGSGRPLDVSRTVGWFTRSRLLQVDLARLRLGAGWSHPGDLVELVARVARADAESAGALTHEALRAARGRHGAHVLVNYLGTYTAPGADEYWRPLVAAPGPAGTEPGTDLLPVTHPLTLDVLHVRGADGTRAAVTWGSQAGVAAAPVAEAWARALDDLCGALEDTGAAPAADGDGDLDDWWTEEPDRPALAGEGRQ
ncbi:hypothetical protein GCM10027063_15990 [Promicromonospora xylanilytica]